MITLKISNVGEVKADLKSWLARTKPHQEPQIHAPSGIDKFDFVTSKIREGLGEKGIVAIINARGENDPEGSDFRYEWFFNQGKEKVQPIKDGSAFYVPGQDVYVVKGQEVWVRDSKKDPIASFLFYNLPIGRNINSKTLLKAIQEARDLSCIIGVSKIKDKEDFLTYYSDILSSIDFIVLHSGTDSFFKDARKIERELCNSQTEAGAISVTGTYDIAVGDKKPFVGRCYTKFSHPLSTHELFFDYLRANLRSATPPDSHKESLAWDLTKEKIKHNVKSVGDRLRGWKNTFFTD